MLVFLDIDGVLVPAKSWQRPAIMQDGFPAFDAKAVRVLQKIISENTTVMLTTSHKSKYSIAQWKEIFSARGIEVNNLKSLRPNLQGKSRKEEIIDWFYLNKVNETFIIIDDDKSLNELPAALKENLILTSPLIGLTETHLEQINTVLQQHQPAAMQGLC